MSEPVSSKSTIGQLKQSACQPREAGATAAAEAAGENLALETAARLPVRPARRAEARSGRERERPRVERHLVVSVVVPDERGRSLRKRPTGHGHAQVAAGREARRSRPGPGGAAA